MDLFVINAIIIPTCMVAEDIQLLLNASAHILNVIWIDFFFSKLILGASHSHSQ